MLKLPQVPGYTVEGELAAGGQGVVLRARHTASGRPVALKLSFDTQPSAKRRFLQEARVLAALQHPNLVRAYEHGEVEGVPWLSMEQVVGESLASLVKTHGPPAKEQVGRLLATVAHALARCHQAGVIHRDLKPENVLVERATGRPVVVDFGLVKRDPNQLHLASLDDGPDLSLSQSIKGTPGYMAPEQVNPREFGAISPATDVYALGGLLYFLLTGEPPFGGKVPAVVMRKVTRKAPRDPRELRPDAPAPLAALCLRCLEKQQGDRPASATAFAAEVAAAAGIPPVPAPSVAPLALAPLPPESESGSESGSGEEHRPARATARLPFGTLAEGAEVAGYRVERLLARGGGGAVYVARAQDGTPVALKVLHAGLTDERQRERFVRELEVGRSFRHAGVVPVLGGGVEGGRGWMALELLEGARTIDQYAREEGLVLAERLSLMLQLADAVQAAHAAGLIHRDLKPDNVLVTPDGKVKVIDFGLAKHLDKERLTMSGAVMGTVHYMAPEQVRGQGAQADARTDVWALGVILHELICGQRPFEGESSLELMAAILEDEPPDPCRGLEEAPRGLREVVQVALAKDADQRFASALAFGRDLAAAASGSGAVSAFDRARARTRRRYGAALVGGALAMAAILFGGGVFAKRARAERRAQALRDLDDAAWQLLCGEAPLASAGDELAALEARLAELDPPLHAHARASVAVVGELVAAAKRGRPPEAPGADVVADDGPCAQTLVAACAAFSGDAAVAVKTLGERLEAGAARPELRRWRAHARARLGLASRADAQELEGDLAAWTQAAGADALSPPERFARARARLLLNDVPGALQAVEGLAVPPDLRWELALGRGDALLSLEPAELLSTARALTPLPAPNPRVKDLLRKLRRRLSTLARQTTLPPRDMLEAAALIWLDNRLDPEGKPPEADGKALVDTATSYRDPTDTPERSELAASLAERYPDDFSVQRRVAIYTQGAIYEHQAPLLPALRRAIERAKTPEQRRELEYILCRELGEISVRHAKDGAPRGDPESSECLERTARLIPQVKEVEQGWLHASRCRAHYAQGEKLKAIAEVEQGLKLIDDPMLHGMYAEILDELDRADEAVREALRFLEVVQDGTAWVDMAVRVLWDRQRAQHPEVVLKALHRHLEIRPNQAGWWTRRAYLELGAGDRGAAEKSLERAAFLFGRDVDPSKRALGERAEKLKKTLDAEELRKLVVTIEEMRGTGDSP
ncbi:MAG: protein kinase [Planctomycetota bacterium]